MREVCEGGGVCGRCVREEVCEGGTCMCRRRYASELHVLG